MHRSRADVARRKLCFAAAAACRLGSAATLTRASRENTLPINLRFDRLGLKPMLLIDRVAQALPGHEAFDVTLDNLISALIQVGRLLYRDMGC